MGDVAYVATEGIQGDSCDQLSATRERCIGYGRGSVDVGVFSVQGEHCEFEVGDNSRCLADSC